MFVHAKRDAEAFASCVESGQMLAPVYTVADACRRYADGRPEAEARFRRGVYGDPLASIKLAKLGRFQLKEWRKRLEDRPALVSRRGGREPLTRPRAPSTVNRDMAVLRAALNRVLPSGAPGTESAWQESLRAIRHADRQRTLYLDRRQRRRLLRHICCEAKAFVHTLCLLPFRPGMAAGLTVGDFDKRTSELSIGNDKSGKGRRILLPPPTAQFFADLADGQPLTARLLPRRNGVAWDRHSWKVPIAKAAAAARLPAGVTAYTLRHSVITDLVNQGLPLLTIAQLSDTSVEMIERHYGHLCRPAAKAALASLVL